MPQRKRRRTMSTTEDEASKSTPSTPRKKRRSLRSNSRRKGRGARMSTSAKKAPASGEKKKRRRKRKESYNLFIFKIMRTVHDKLGVSKQAMAILNSFAYDIEARLCREAGSLVLLNKKKMLGMREMETATNLCLPGELRKHATTEGKKACQNYVRSYEQSREKKQKLREREERAQRGKGKGKGKTKTRPDGKGLPFGGRPGVRLPGTEVITQTKRAQLMMPVTRIKKHLVAGNYAPRIARLAPVFCASVVEYMLAELLELAGNAAQDNKRKIIKPRHVMLAIRNDDEFNELLAGVTIPWSGRIVYLHPSLVMKKSKKKYKKKVVSQEV